MHRFSPVLLLGLCVSLLASFGSAGAARADREADGERVRVVLAMVAVSAAPRAPAEDVARVRADAYGQLTRGRERIRRCLAEHDLREDPLRSRERRIEIRTRLARSGRPERVWVHRDSGVPHSVRRCLLESVRSLSVRPAPRGPVLVRVVYDLSR